MSKGFKSTEFWISLAAIAAASYLAKTGADVATIGAVVGPSIAYIGSRGLAKMGTDGK